MVYLCDQAVLFENRDETGRGKQAFGLVIPSDKDLSAFEFSLEIVLGLDERNDLAFCDRIWKFGSNSLFPDLVGAEFVIVNCQASAEVVLYAADSKSSSSTMSPSW